MGMRNTPLPSHFSRCARELGARAVRSLWHGTCGRMRETTAGYRKWVREAEDAETIDIDAYCAALHFDTHAASTHPPPQPPAYPASPLPSYCSRWVRRPRCRGASNCPRVVRSSWTSHEAMNDVMPRYDVIPFVHLVLPSDLEDHLRLLRLLAAPPSTPQARNIRNVDTSDARITRALLRRISSNWRRSGGPARLASPTPDGGSRRRATLVPPLLQSRHGYPYHLPRREEQVRAQTHWQAGDARHHTRPPYLHVSGLHVAHLRVVPAHHRMHARSSRHHS